MRKFKEKLKQMKGGFNPMAKKPKPKVPVGSKPILTRRKVI